MVLIKLALAVILAGSSVFLFAENSPESLLWDKNDIKTFELIENIPGYSSWINWTTGKIRTEVSFNLSGKFANIGKNININDAIVHDELRQNLIKAMGYVRISDLFLLKDYYSVKSEVRYEIISYADDAFFYPLVQKPKSILGIVELNLFGKKGIAHLFYRDVPEKKLTNYIQPETKDQEYFDGLIIDTMTFREFNPSLEMRIFDQDGVLLYGPETVDRKILDTLGVCEYTTSLTHAFNSPRSGNHVFYTLPFDIKGKMKTAFVMNNKDAARLFANPMSVKYLNQSRVVVVKNR